MCAAALLAAGCSGSTGSAPSVEKEAGPPTAILTATSGAFDEDYYAAKQIESENFIAECMVAEGFEYLPQVYSDPPATAFDDLARQDTEEWAARHGYGIALAMDVPTQERVDTNADYLASLSAAEAEAYQDALYGADADTTTGDDATSDPPSMLDTLADAGCWGAAELVVYRDRDALQASQFDEINDALRAFYPSTLEDARMVELSARWADCMADAGFTDLATPDDAVTSIQAAYAALPLESTTAEGERLPSGDDLTAFRTLEVSTALADLGCQEQVGWATISRSDDSHLRERKRCPPLGGYAGYSMHLWLSQQRAV